jgi:predicted nucleic acid-binding protein
VIVADANLLLALTVEGGMTALTESALNRDPEWAVPVLWRSEVRAGLMRYFQHGLMSFESVMVSWHMAEEAVGGREYTVDARKVLELAADSKCSAYDCEYVALARDLGVPLVTADKQILKAFPKNAVALEKFAKKKR